MTPADMDILDWARSRRWFYRYPLPGGHWTLEPGDPSEPIHEARRAMLLKVLADRFGARLGQISAIDLACHQGYFSLAMSERVGRVQSLDVNTDSLEDAARIARLQGRENITFTHGDVQEIDPARLERSDFVLMYGLIYHIEDPMRLLRRAANWCADTMLIETQLADFDVATRIEWGAYDHFRTVEGLFALVDDQENAEGGVTELALVPSLKALQKILGALGFSRVEVVTPLGGSEQLNRGHRAVVAAYR